MQLFPAIDHAAKKIGRLTRVIDCRVRLTRVPFHTCSIGCSRQYGLPVGQSTQRDSVKAAERVKWVLLDPGPLDRGVQEFQIKEGVVPNQNGARTICIGNCLSYRRQYM